MAHAGKGCVSGGISCQCWPLAVQGLFNGAQPVICFLWKCCCCFFFYCCLLSVCVFKREKEIVHLWFFYHCQNSTWFIRKQNIYYFKSDTSICHFQGRSRRHWLWASQKLYTNGARRWRGRTHHCDGHGLHRKVQPEPSVPVQVSGYRGERNRPSAEVCAHWFLFDLDKWRGQGASLMAQVGGGGVVTVASVRLPTPVPW